MGFGFIVFAASLLRCRFPVLIQRVTRQVYLVILIYARPALVKLHLTEKPMYQHQRAIAFYPVDILFHVVQHRLAVVKRHPQTIPRQSFDIPYSWYHNCTFFQVGLLTLLILVLMVQLDFIIPEEKKKRARFSETLLFSEKVCDTMTLPRKLNKCLNKDEFCLW